MSNYVDHVLNKFRSKGALLDTNLSVLLMVGRTRPELIGPQGFKRVAAYTFEDYALLDFVLAEFSIHVTTPHILTEVSNFLGQLAEPAKSECMRTFQKQIFALTELPFESKIVAANTDFSRLGLTDSSLRLNANDYLVISSDARCISVLYEAGYDALNFNLLRQLSTLK